MRRLVGANILFSASLALPTYKRVADNSTLQFTLLYHILGNYNLLFIIL